MLASLFLSALLLTLLTFTQSTTYPITSTPLGRTFHGIGGLSGGGATSRLLIDYAEPYRSHILDYLFLPSFGASLQILKVEIGGDAQSTEGTEASHMHIAGEENYQRGYEWWLMKEAKRRNPNIKLYALSWGFPGWVAEGGTSPLTNSTAEYVTKWILGGKREHDLTLDYIGIWNENAYSKDYILTLRRNLDQANLATQIVAADDCCGGAWSICDNLVHDAEFSAAVFAVGGHYPNSAITDSCAALGKPLWASEDFSSHFDAGGCWTRLLNRNYALGNMTATVAWNLIAAYYDELPYGGDGLMHSPQPWSGWYEVGPVIWATAHTTQFTAPGWRYLEHGSGVGQLSGGGTFVSLTNGKDLTIVLETMTKEVSGCVHEDAPSDPVTTQEVVFKLGAGFEGITRFNVFFSSLGPASSFFRYTSLPVVNGSVTFTVLPNSLYTLSTLNGTKGTHPNPPSPKPFPFPYHDDFNSYNVSAPARYLTDQSGSYEIVQAQDPAHGKVLRQMMPRLPVAWCGEAPYTYTIVGDHSWRGVSVELDVLIEEEGLAFVAQGVRDGGCVGQNGSPGVVFAISTDGQWTVSNSTSLKTAAGQGKATIEAGHWHHLRLDVTSTGATVWLDGSELATVKELTSAQHQGWVAIGTSWSYVQFDQLSIGPVPTSHVDVSAE